MKTNYSVTATERVLTIIWKRAIIFDNAESWLKAISELSDLLMTVHGEDLLKVIDAQDLAVTIWAEKDTQEFQKHLIRKLEAENV